MKEYIEREALLEKLAERDLVLCVTEWDIKNAPVADVVERKRGRWVVGGNCNHVPHRIKNPEKWVTYKCSECGYSNGRKQSNFCPICGADMREVDHAAD